MKNNTFVNNGNKWLSTAQHKAVGEGHPQKSQLTRVPFMCKGWKPITYTAGRAFSARGFWSGGGRGNTISLGEREGRLFFCIDRSGDRLKQANFLHFAKALCAQCSQGMKTGMKGGASYF